MMSPRGRLSMLSNRAAAAKLAAVKLAKNAKPESAWFSDPHRAATEKWVLLYSPVSGTCTAALTTRAFHDLIRGAQTHFHTIASRCAAYATAETHSFHLFLFLSFLRFCNSFRTILNNT
jgi:hypothetical protein